MTSFPGAARRVRDDGEPLERRLWALRECALRFGTYGFRATWHHLIVRNGIPELLEGDPHSLVRAVDELGEARELWLPHLIAYERQRRAEKAERRVPDPADLPRFDLYCPDPEVHPRERLAVVVGRAVERWRTGTEFCAGCAGPRVTFGICPRCGVWRTPAGSDARISRLGLGGRRRSGGRRSGGAGSRLLGDGSLGDGCGDDH